jgi:glycosyltransferase involved in cell wall biosynthesis
MPCASLDDLPSPFEDKTGWPWTEQSDPLPETQSDHGSWPKISIATPSYNQGEFIEETIRSVLLQGYPNLEYIVMDGGSTDDSVDIIEKYVPWIDDWESETDRGQTHAINKAFRRFTGEVVTWINSDDVLAPGALHTIGRTFMAEEAEFVVGKTNVIDRNGSVRSVVEPRVFDDAHQKFYDVHIIQPSSFFDLDLYEEHGPFHEDAHYAMDMIFWIQLREADVSFDTVDAVISYFRSYGESKSAEGVMNFVHDILDRFRDEPPLYREAVEAVPVNAKWCSLEGWVKMSRFVRHPISLLRGARYKLRQYVDRKWTTIQNR